LKHESFHFWKSWCSYKQGEGQALDALKASYVSSGRTKDPWAALLSWSAQTLKNEKQDFAIFEGSFSSKNFDEADRDALKLIKRVGSL